MSPATHRGDRPDLYPEDVDRTTRYHLQCHVDEMWNFIKMLSRWDSGHSTRVAIRMAREVVESIEGKDANGPIA